MGSRAVVLVCRSEADAVARFGVTPGMGSGAVWTRTGRPFFGPALTSELLDRVRCSNLLSLSPQNQKPPFQKPTQSPRPGLNPARG